MYLFVRLIWREKPRYKTPQNRIMSSLPSFRQNFRESDQILAELIFGTLPLKFVLFLNQINSFVILLSNEPKGYKRFQELNFP